MRKILPFVLSVFTCMFCLLKSAEGQEPKLFSYPFFVEVDSSSFKMFSLEQLVERELGFPEGYSDTARVVIKIPYTIAADGEFSYMMIGNGPDSLWDKVSRIMSSVSGDCYPALDRSLRKMDYSDTLRILFHYPRFDAAQYGQPFAKPDYYDGPGGRVLIHSKPEFRSTRESSRWQEVFDNVKLPRKTRQTDGWIAYTVKADCSMADITYDPVLPENVCEAIAGVLEKQDLWKSPATDWFENPSDYRDTLYFSITKKLTVEFSPMGNDVVMPSFEGGDLGRFREWVIGQIRYPAAMAHVGMVGDVIFSFVIENDGELGCLTILEAPHMVFALEVMRVLSISPHWKPGVVDGKRVRVKFTLPVRFAIRN